MFTIFLFCILSLSRCAFLTDVMLPFSPSFVFVISWAVEEKYKCRQSDVMLINRRKEKGKNKHKFKKCSGNDKIGWDLDQSGPGWIITSMFQVKTSSPSRSPRWESGNISDLLSCWLHSYRRLIYKFVWCEKCFSF